MNRVILMGNLVSTPELRCTASNKNYARFTLAVKRDKETTDFINCISWGKQSEFIAKYFQKGQSMIISGRIQTGNYEDKDGNKKYTTDIYVEEVEFVGSKKKEETKADPFEDFGNEIDNYLE